MKITLEGTPKEIADLVSALQGQQNKDIKTIASKVFSKFCDEYDIHSDEIDTLLAKLTTESDP